ncbi:hypothetical protein FGSG_09285 [Fusarium graminearum PH-1]|uniref:Chromosome 4, complete genome n=1 Tax=Gibberella zeae (strain ATCC MYA-4620 / CBS 123657 / FGSC 9075 / NRRL 31084 / PH-1) TaxID=229533 RepID=I1RY50_GIBZE|nr:hypothetical protein FGSG_09285 [Fusarium graminearum PH-1]ESU15836.1 hypothetical protein FGSG_09285 [Fusarium graminearum PH-1]CEF83677.1 unnamed protein product [Fusarium graminearum]|eukprot:XP_011328480.1 hypothetical protein FGSG_09285 [Fusarium graminearum PH-1]
MPQDPNLYGQRPTKKPKRDATLSTSLDFTAQLTSLMSNASSSATSAGRPRPQKEGKDDIFKGSKPKRSKESDGSKKLHIKEVAGTEEETQELARARRRMEEKARLYAAMKRGDYVAKENEAAPLIDFDRKWAEGEETKEDYETSSDEDNGEESGEMVEYEDEFGRARQVTKAEKEKLDRRTRRGLLGAEELERMSARPSVPSNLIVGDTIQAMAFNPDDPNKMEELARKRDRSATPPPAQHYDADWEIRTKGTGFYKFSQDDETRTTEMEGLAKERRKTEEQRRVREEQKEARRREIEKRREEMATRRAKKQADSFLDGLGG